MFITNLNQNRNSLIDEMINDIFRIYPTGYTGFSNSSNYKTDSDDDGVILTMNVPGYNKKLIDVSVSGDTLTIEGKVHSGDTDGFNHTFGEIDFVNVERLKIWDEDTGDTGE